MENCIFCKIAADEIPAQKTFEDEEFVAFLDINPKAPGHTLLIPKRHYRWFDEMPDDEVGGLFVAAKKIAQQFKKEGADYVRLSLVGKDVPHVHVHLMPRKLHEGGMEV